MRSSDFRKCFTAILALAMLILPLSLASADSLDFDPGICTVKDFAVGDLEVTCLACEGIVYVSNPVDIDYQSMNFYVPLSVADDDSTTPIFFPNGVGGYNPALPGEPGAGRDGGPNAALVALSKGYVVASAGARGKTMEYGRAPAGIVDLKAAVRYLRYNDDVMPGDAEKIISNGTSAGGAMSSLLGATGNSEDYVPYLEEIGAAEARDDIFAASCYCPITNLNNSDMAYEWLFNAEHTWYWFMGPTPLTDEQLVLSDLLKAMFPAYLNRLGLEAYEPVNAMGQGLKWAPGQVKRGVLLTLDEYGDGNFNDYAKSFVMASAQKVLDEGGDLYVPGTMECTFDWVTIENGEVTDIDLAEYAACVTRMKPVPAFDNVDLSFDGTWENILFGAFNTDEATPSKHFTRFSFERSLYGHPIADPQIIKMMNPMEYIGTNESTITENWRIRHGSADRDTSIAIPIILTTKLRNAGYDVDFAMPWGQGHGGDYDLDELFAWIEDIVDTHHPRRYGHFK